MNASTVTYFGKSFESMHILKVIRLLNSGVLDYQIFIFFSQKKKTCQYITQNENQGYMAYHSFLKGGFFSPIGHTNLFKP